MMRTTYNTRELEQLLAVCTSTFYNLNGFLPDVEELCRQIGSEYSAAIRRLLGAQPFSEGAVAV